MSNHEDNDHDTSNVVSLHQQPAEEPRDLRAEIAALR